MWGKIDTTFNDRFRMTAGLRWEEFERLAVPINPLEFDPDIGIIPIPDEDLDDFATVDDTITRRWR